jgi:hypothetical protein
MRSLTAIIVTILVLSSCKKEDVFQSKISIDLDKSQKGKFSDIFSEINYLLLDVGEKEALVRPFHILFDKDRIVVEDRDLSNIHFFDLEGKRLHTIKSDPTGGPGTLRQSEFLQLKGNHLIISDVPLSKTLTFDLNGIFQSEKKEDLRYDAFYNFNDYRILYTGLDELNQGKIFIRQSLSNPADTSTLYYFPKEYFWFGINSKDGFMKDQASEKVYFTIPYSYEIAKFGEKADLEGKFEFDLGNYGISHEDRYRLSEGRKLKSHLAENRLINDIHSFFPLKNHFFMYLYQHDPNGKPTHHFLVLDREMKVSYQSIDPTNDLDEMIIGGVPWTYHENKIYIIVNSVSFYNAYIKKFSGKKVEIKPGNVHDFFQKNQEMLKDDQTVLVSLTLKDLIN